MKGLILLFKYSPHHVTNHTHLLWLQSEEVQ